jgi:hypothetical protein
VAQPTIGRGAGMRLTLMVLVVGALVSRSWMDKFGLVKHAEPRPVRLSSYDLGAGTGTILGRGGGKCNVTADQRGQRFLVLEVRFVCEHFRPEFLDGAASDRLAARRVSEDGILLVKGGDSFGVASVGAFDEQAGEVFGLECFLAVGHDEPFRLVDVQIPAWPNVNQKSNR